MENLSEKIEKSSDKLLNKDLKNYQKYIHENKSEK